MKVPSSLPTAGFICALFLWIPAQALQRPVPSHQRAAPAAPQKVATVNGVPVMSDRLAVALNALLPLTSFHRNVDAAKQAELREKALWGLIDEELQHQASKAMRVAVTDAEVEAGVGRAVKAYKSPQAFEQARRKSGATMDDLRREIRRALAIQQAFTRAVGAKCQVSDAETAEFYAKNPDRFVMPEQLHLYTITLGVDPSATKAEWLKGRETAVEVRRQLLAGASFEDLARRYSTDPAKEKGGDMGLVHRGSLVEEFEAAVKDMAPGQISEVVQTIHGFHVLRLARILPPAHKPLGDMKAQLRKDLTEKRCTEMGDAWRQQLRSAAKIVIFDEGSKATPTKPS